MTDKKYQKSHLDSFRRLPVDMRVRCVEALRTEFSKYPDTQNEITELIKKDPYVWWAPYHHGWGTGMRNFLRDSYTDDQLPSTPYDDDRGAYKNWDDYYIGIVEVAFKEGIYYLLDESERV